MSQLGSKKSRRGCARCKQRRVKCDELTPCGNCERRNEECSLLEPTPTSSEHSFEPGLPTTSTEWTEDLELMHAYGTQSTMFWRGIRDEAYPLWAHYIPELAVKYPWLMHGILTAAALHLAHIHRHRSAHFLQLADKHETVALSAFRSILSADISNENADALFGLASILSVSAMARACEEAEVADVPGTMSTDSITALLFLTRGVRDVIQATLGRVQQGPMLALFDLQCLPDGLEVALPSTVTAQFVAITELLHNWGLDPEALVHCKTALASLRVVYETVAYFAPTAIIETGTVWRWPIHVPTGFVRLIQVCCQPALVVFAHFAAIATSVRLAWYNQSWSDYAINGIGAALEDSMKHWVEWPREQAKDRLVTLLGVRQAQSPPTSDAIPPLDEMLT